MTVAWLCLSALPSSLVQAENAAKEALSLEIEAPKDAFSIDVLRVRIRLTNKSGGALTLTEPPTPRGGISVEIQTPTMEEFAEASTAHGTGGRLFGKDPETVLDPGEYYQTTLYISPALKRSRAFALPTPGKLKIRAIYTDEPSKLRIVSPVSVITLTPPDSLDDGVRRLIVSEHWHRLAKDGEDEKTAKPFAEFYASGAAFHHRELLALRLGQSYQSGSPVVKEIDRIDARTGAVVGKELVATNEPKYAHAIAAFREASESKDPFIKGQALHHLAECYLAQLNPDAGLHCLALIPFKECDTDLQKESMNLAETLKELKEALQKKEKK